MPPRSITAYDPLRDGPAAGGPPREPEGMVPTHPEEASKPAELEGVVHLRGQASAPPTVGEGSSAS
jgi:hypothetical protein